MSSPSFGPRRVASRALAAALLLLGGTWLASDLPAQDPAKDPPPAKRQRVEEEEDPKATPAKPAPGGDKAPQDMPAKKGADEGNDKAKQLPPPRGKRTEEEEDSPRPTKKVINVDDDTPPAKAPPGRAPAAAVGDLAALANHTKNSPLAKLYREFAVPHDLLGLGSETSPRWESVEPIPFFVGADAKHNWPKGSLKVRLVNARGERGATFTPGTVREVRHYEQLAVQAVNAFLREQQALREGDRAKLSREEQLDAAQKVLTEALRFHESAKTTGVRKGEEWEEVEKPLKRRLLEIRLEQLKALADAGQWEPAFELTVVLAREFSEPEQQQQIAKPLTDLLQASLRSGVESEHGTRQALRRLRELEDQFPDKKVLAPITKGLQRHAQALYDLAKKREEEQRPDEAQKLVGQAVELDPGNNEFRTYQRTLLQKHRILRVGVRGLPESLSPALARTDSELRAVELMFESLVKFGVDPAGNARFVSGLCEGRPRVEALCRKFVLPRAYWSDGKPLTANDIRETVKWYKKGRPDEMPAVWADLLDNLQVGRDPYRVTVPMQQGYIEPLALMTFKIQPARPDLESDEFARHPVGSGPYALGPANSDGGRSCVSFIVNPLFGSRPGKEGLPRVREVRFFAYDKYDPKDKNANPTKEFERPPDSAPLDMILDLTAEHAAAIARKAGAAHVHVRRPGANASRTRRVYFLAVNQKVSALEKTDVRRALAHAINREKLLDEFFREKTGPAEAPILGKLHAALNGPYPAGSWACNPKVGVPKVPNSLDLYDEVLARNLYKQATAAAAPVAVPVKLKYPDDDPAVGPAMDALCQQLSVSLGLKAEAVPVSARQLQRDVEIGDYELAYHYYDFRDETYSLWPLLAPRANGQTIFGTATVGPEIDAAFQDARSRRQFEAVKQDTWKIHDELYRSMPLIPLWQLDPLSAVHDAVKAPPYDPLLVFPEVETWVAEPRD
jgi:ABC-type transport system substrate-binding protein